MKSIGDTLRSARETHGFSLEQAVHETNISRRHLIALEEEKFEIFVADTYLIGFLRNYATFLNVDPERILGQYRNYKLNESPIPMEELIGPPRGTLWPKILMGIICLLIIIVAAIFGLPKLKSVYAEFRQQRTLEETPESREIRPSLPIWEGRVYTGDTLILETLQGERRITLSNEDNHIKLEAGNAGNWSMLPGEEIYLPDEDTNFRWRIYLKDLDIPGNGALLEIHQIPKQPNEQYRLDEAITLEPPSGLEIRYREPRVILNSAIPHRFVIDISFNDFCLFRYSVDHEETVETVLTEGDDIQLEVDTTVTVWVSNAGAVQLKIDEKEYRFGGSGEVAVGLIRWISDEEGDGFNLVQFAQY